MGIPMPRPKSPPLAPVATLAEASVLLGECALALAEFRSRLNRAGYPFREPESCARILARLNGMQERIAEGFADMGSEEAPGGETFPS